MSEKYSFIKAVSIILKVVWYVQWLFIGILITFAITIYANPTFVDLDKLNGFKVEFKKVDLPESTISLSQEKHKIFLSNGEGRLHINNFKSSYVLYRLAGAFLQLSIFMLIIDFLRKLFGNLSKGDFFISQNGVFIKYISYLIMLFEVLPRLLYYIIDKHIENTLILEGIIFKSRLNFDLSIILLGLLIYSISQVFIQGNILKEENELTI